MANFDNIKEYADFSHDAAKYGGPKQYLEEFGNAKYALGVEDEKNTEGWKALIVVGVTIAFWEMGKAGVDKLKNMRIKRREKLLEQAELAKVSYYKHIHKNDAEESLPEYIDHDTIRDV